MFMIVRYQRRLRGLSVCIWRVGESRSLLIGSARLLHCLQGFHRFWPKRIVNYTNGSRGMHSATSMLIVAYILLCTKSLDRCCCIADLPQMALVEAYADGGLQSVYSYQMAVHFG